ncbi:MAG TPA: type IV pilus assembly protein PilM [Pirellulales bacterium]|nr:type IV pilus assembly protein PilM [Pirellulales bacterium]
MARSDAVWGIDIGQCALKALRLRPHEDESRVSADAFDYIEYPKILSQPDVDPAELVQEALKQFLSRNSVRGDKVVISVSGQSGLARFIKLPPVESKKIPDIVKYEAKQQIPFALEDVVWDYQQMAGGSMVEGFAMETEVGLFAMKRDQVFRALKPFNDAGIEVDIVQLTPLALYNFVAFDQMPELPPPEEYDPESPPESVVLISLGTDTTDLVVTNGFRVWQRSIPIGGNHFTKALTKELKLTFASAEHLKRNATQAEDPKALFQAMRPVFNDLLTEVQRSIGYFSNLDRRAKIGRAVALGNAMKLPGLQRYLAQNLGFDLTKLESFRVMSGTAVVDSPVFKENVPAFGVCYGLALQGLRDTKIKTNLLPREIALDRMVRAKKPWAVGAAALVLLGMAVSFGSHYRQRKSVRMDDFFGPQIQQADTVVKEANQYKTDFDGAKTSYTTTAKIGEGFVQNVSGRDVWLKVMKAVNLCLPRNEGERPAEITERNEVNIEDLECVYYEKLEDWYSVVKGDYEKQYKEFAAPAQAAGGANAGAAPPAENGAPGVAPTNGNAQPGAPPAPGANPAAPTATAAAPPAPAAPPANPAPAPANPAATPADPAANGGAPADQAAPAPAGGDQAAAAPAQDAGPGAGPSGPGYVFQLRGHHYHNKKLDENQGAVYLQRAFLKNLRKDEIEIPFEERRPGGPAAFPVKKLGIGYPVLLDAGNINYNYKLMVEDFEGDDPKAAADAKGKAAGDARAPGNAGPMPQGANPMAGGPGEIQMKPIEAPRFDFIIQFCWQAPSPDQLEQIAAQIPSGQRIVEEEGEAEAGEEMPADEAGEEMTDEAEGKTPPEGDAKPAEPDANAAGEKPADAKPGDTKPADNKPAEAPAAEEKPAAEPKPASPENK